MSNFISRFLNRHSLTRKQCAYLANTLRGDHPEQACWADESLREHALKLVAENFGSDWLWCMQVTLAIYFVDPQSIEQIDRIVAEHVESRRSTYPAALFAGRGWNPAKAMNFDGEAPRYWRGYVAVGPEHWTLFELLKNRTTPDDLMKQSGYQFSGSRGCVRHLTLSRGTEAASARAFAETFVHSASGLISNAVGNAGPDALWQAVRELAAFDGRAGAARLRFVTSEDQERGQRPWRSFNLTVDYEP